MRYSMHVFVCTNVRENGVSCQGNSLVEKLKLAVERAGIDKTKVRINRSGCLGQCAFGPSIVVYPEGVWYGKVKEADLDEIVQSHLIDGIPVARLRTDL